MALRILEDLALLAAGYLLARLVEHGKSTDIVLWLAVGIVIGLSLDRFILGPIARRLERDDERPSERFGL